MSVNKLSLKPLDLLKLNREAITSEGSKHYQFHNKSWIGSRQNVSQDEQIQFKAIVNQSNAIPKKGRLGPV